MSEIKVFPKQGRTTNHYPDAVVLIDMEGERTPHPVTITQTWGDGDPDNIDNEYEHIVLTVQQAIDLCEWIVDYFTPTISREDLIARGIMKEATNG